MMSSNINNIHPLHETLTLDLSNQGYSKYKGQFFLYATIHFTQLNNNNNNNSVALVRERTIPIKRFTQLAIFFFTKHNKVKLC
jgi:hypothetical protein